MGPEVLGLGWLIWIPVEAILFITIFFLFLSGSLGEEKLELEET